MLGELLRKKTRIFVERIARLVGALGFSPNMLTILGFLLTFPVALFLASGRWLLAGILLALASLFDVIDGAVARVMGKVSRFGAFLDSTLDRFSEAVIYLGLTIYYLKSQDFTSSLLCYLTLIGSFMVSYTRARAEGVGVECREGFFTRFERMLALILGLLIGKPEWALWFLALFSNLTAFQRIYLVWKALKGKDGNWGVYPRLFKRGSMEHGPLARGLGDETAALSDRPTSGAQNHGEPQAREGGGNRG